MTDYINKAQIICAKKAQLCALEEEHKKLTAKYNSLKNDANALERTAIFLHNRLSTMEQHETDRLITHSRIERSLQHCVERNTEMQVRHLPPKLYDYFILESAIRFRVQSELASYKKLM